MCIAMVVYVKDPRSGACCEYPSPCTAGIAGKQYTDATCTTATGAP
jgi:hypothetical protein